MGKDEWKVSIVNWLEGFPWQLFCSLTFRPGLLERHAGWRLRRWIEDCERVAGTTAFEWIAVPELGRSEFHFDVLIGGLEQHHADYHAAFAARWNRANGDARIDFYKPGVGGVRHMLRTISPREIDRIQMDLFTHRELETESNMVVFMHAETRRISSLGFLGPLPDSRRVGSGTDLASENDTSFEREAQHEDVRENTDAKEEL